MSWLIIEIWNAARDTWRTKQENAWEDELINLNAEKEVSRIKAKLSKSRARLVDAEAELQKVKADRIWSKLPTEEGRKNGLSGIDKESPRETETSQYTRG